MVSHLFAGARRFIHSVIPQVFDPLPLQWPWGSHGGRRSFSRTAQLLIFFVSQNFARPRLFLGLGLRGLGLVEFAFLKTLAHVLSITILPP